MKRNNMALLDQEITYYDGSTSTNDGPLPEGKYYAHIIEVTKKFTDKVVNSRNDKGMTHICDLLEVTYKIAEGDYENRRVWSNAIWIFKDPKDDMHTPNPSGNQRYSVFLDRVNYPCKEVEVKDSNGKKKTVKELPIDVDNDHILGKPVLIEVKHRKYTNKDGEEKVAANEAGIHTWEEGSSVDVNDGDDLPF
jgi:hypothetical protein